jgi:pSer/pThr/pTyr-binding forkhead associated (FHA) protein
VSRKLVVQDGDTRRELALTGTLVVGRDPSCEISSPEPRLSRRHAEFRVTPEGIVVRDLQSRNGIRVNGQLVGEAQLRPGDVVHVGHLAIQFVPDGASRAVAPFTATSETLAVGVQGAPIVDDRTRVVSPAPARTASRQLTQPVTIQPAVLDDRTRVAPPSASGSQPAVAVRSAGPGGPVAPAPTTSGPSVDPGDIVIREGVTGPQPPWQLGVAATLDVGTLARAAWGRRVLVHGVLLALAVQGVTLLPVIVWESHAFGATVLRAWYVLVPAAVASVLAGLLGAALIARLTIGGVAASGSSSPPPAR